MAVHENGSFSLGQLSGFLDSDVCERLLKLKVIAVTNSGSAYYFQVGKEWRTIVLDRAYGFAEGIRRASADFLALYEVK